MRKEWGLKFFLTRAIVSIVFVNTPLVISDFGKKYTILSDFYDTLQMLKWA